MDYIETVTVKRIHGVLKGEENDLLPEYGYDGQGSFVYVELAKLNLAGQMQSQVIALIDNEVSNGQLPQEEAASVTRTVVASKNMIAQKLGRVITVIECYRVKAGKNKEVRVQIACSSDMAMQSAKTAIREELAKEGEQLSSQLDAMLGL